MVNVRVVTEICKGHNCVTSLCGVMLLILSTLSDNASSLYQVLSKYLKEFQSYRLEQMGRR